MTSPLLRPDGKPWTAADINRLHQSDDVDRDLFSHHHTLGDKRFQAAPGDHLHDGRYVNLDGFPTGKTSFLVEDFNVLGAWTPFTGSIGGTGWSDGSNPVYDCQYWRYGKFCAFRYKLTFGTGATSGTGSLTMALPFTFTGGGRGMWVGEYTKGGVVYSLTCCPQSGSNIAPGYTHNTTYARQLLTTATVTALTGAATASGDIIEISGEYQIL